MKTEINMIDKFLSVKQVADFLNCKQSSVYAWAKSGKLPAYKINGLLRFDLREIQDWIKKCKIQPNTPLRVSETLKKSNIDYVIKNAIDSTLGFKL